MNCAFDKGTKCIALKEKDCEGCVFKKTPQELKAGRKRAKVLLSRLPEYEQKAIKEKYNRGWTRNVRNDKLG